MSDNAENNVVEEVTEEIAASEDIINESAEDGLENATDSEQKSEEDKPKQSGAQKRINELTREKYEARREAEYWKQQAESKANAPTAPAKPNIETFDDYDTYLEALTDWKAREIVQAELNKTNKADQERVEKEQKQQTFAKQQEAVRNKYADFDEVMLSDEFGAIPVHNDVLDVIVNSEYGAEIGYYLAKNIEEAQKIASMSPSAAIKEIGKIEFKLENGKKETETVKTKVTNAPAPITPVTGQNAKVNKDPSQMSDPEFARWRRDQIAKRR